MRKFLGPLLLGIGGFLLTTALLVLLWVPGQVKKTPLDVNSLTVLDGEASYLGSDRSTVKATSHTVTDGDASTGDTAVFQTFSCLMWNADGAAPDCVSAEGPDSALINAGTDAFATDRKTALSVTDQEKYLGANASPHEGLVNKFPFDVEQKPYPFWDSILDRAVDAVFVGEESLDGLNTYKFNISVVDEPAEISSGVQGTYSNDKTMWIDPVTGSIINQTEKQVRVLPDGSAALDMDLAFTAEQVSANVADAKDNGGRLGLVGRLPWIAGLLGLVSLFAGTVLNRRADEEQGGSRSRTREAVATTSAPAAARAPQPSRPAAPAPRSTPDEPTRPLFGGSEAASTVCRPGTSEPTVARPDIELPEGAVRLPDGTIRLADGTVRRMGIDPNTE